MHGRSLVALSQTSKDFYEIAVKLMYHTLSERQAVSPHGRMRFIPRHASLVRTLDLGTFGSAAEEKARAFATLPLLPNVNELHLNGDAMATIFGGQAAFDAGATVDSERHALPRNPSAIEIEQEEYALAREIWRERAPHLRAVQMFALQVEDATRFLDTMTKLESVNLIILKDLEAYLDALAHRPHLLHLTIRSGRPGTWNWPTGPLEWTTSLKSLNLHNLDVTPGFYTFLDHFAPSLQTLNIVFSTKLSQNRVLPPSPVLPSPFPFLKELHLHIVDCTVASAILSSLAPTAGGRLPSPLQNVDVTFTSIGDLDETLETLLDAFKSTLKLRRVVYGLIAECNIYSEGRTASAIQISHRLELLKKWGVKEGDTVFEVGCGQGDATSVLATAVGPTGHVTAVDPAPLTYGGPWTLGQAQDYLSASPLGPRITWVEADPIAYLTANPNARFKVALLCHSVYYFASPALLRQTLSTLARHAERVVISEYALATTTPSAHAHVLAVLTEASLECRKPSSVSNVRTVVSPATLKRVAAEVGLILDSEGIVIPRKELQDGGWELEAVMDDGFPKQVEANVKEEREKEGEWRILEGGPSNYVTNTDKLELKLFTHVEMPVWRR
ncbi:hypothetical protein RQP46_007086 [Phenoliferia psychrophenolica]